MAVQLKYVGDGAWLPGVPAADQEVKTEAEAAELVASGLYEVIGKQSKQAEQPAPPEEA